MIDWTALLAVVLIPLLRAVGGWLLAALEDGEISTFEWNQLWETFVRVGWVPLLAFFGFDVLAGIQVGVWVALFMAGADWLRSSITKSVKAKYV